MKNLTLFFFLFLFCHLHLFSQSCLPEGIDFESQTEIDSFQINFPNCTEIEGQVQILGNNINNLNGLSVLTVVGSDFAIAENDSLKDLTGLNNLTSVGGSMYFMGLGGIKNFTGLESITTINGVLQTEYCDSLTNFFGLNSLTNVSDNIMIGFNPLLSDLSGLENLSSTGGGLSIHHNDNLLNLNSLQNLTSIEGYITISNNENLESLNGIHNIQSTSISGIFIDENSNLSTCDVQSICDYLANPIGTILISNNNTGCNTQAEVETACENASIEEFISNVMFEIFPNPANTSLTIINKKNLKINEVYVFNQFGEKLYNVKSDHESIDISRLNKGIYIVEIKAENNNYRKKLIVN
jgi:hypothetical protein